MREGTRGDFATKNEVRMSDFSTIIDDVLIPFLEGAVFRGCEYLGVTRSTICPEIQRVVMYAGVYCRRKGSDSLEIKIDMQSTPGGEWLIDVRYEGPPGITCPTTGEYFSKCVLPTLSQTGLALNLQRMVDSLGEIL